MGLCSLVLNSMLSKSGRTLSCLSKIEYRDVYRRVSTGWMGWAAEAHHSLNGFVQGRDDAAPACSLDLQGVVPHTDVVLAALCNGHVRIHMWSSLKTIPLPTHKVAVSIVHEPDAITSTWIDLRSRFVLSGSSLPTLHVV